MATELLLASKHQSCLGEGHVRRVAMLKVLVEVFLLQAVVVRMAYALQAMLSLPKSLSLKLWQQLHGQILEPAGVKRGRRVLAVLAATKYLGELAPEQQTWLQRLYVLHALQ